jgi:hypothetical protein
MWTFFPTLNHIWFWLISCISIQFYMHNLNKESGGLYQDCVWFVVAKAISFQYLYSWTLLEIVSGIKKVTILSGIKVIYDRFIELRLRF